jgi:uncharacterized protein YndB with AHSA1/START domain
MEKITFSAVIKAPREKVWDTMLTDATYRIWTEPFHPGSYFKGEWKKGTKMLFLGPGENGGEGGMSSIIEEANRPEFVSIRHVGMISNGVEDTTSDEVKKWTPAHENYTFKEVPQGTELTVEMDSNPEYKEMFTTTWPKAMAKLKELAEK